MPTADQPAPRQSGLAPVAPAGRIEIIDALRGLAVLGILTVNMGAFAGYWPPAGGLSPLNRGAMLAVQFLAQAKFYPLFSFLFGMGLAIQMQRAAQRGRPFLPLYLRRLLVLLAIGLFHAIFIWSGDILVTYALLGFPLLLFRRRSDRTVALAAALLLAFSVLIYLPGPPAGLRRAYWDALAPWRAALGDADRLIAGGSYLEVTALRLKELRLNLAQLGFWGPQILGLFLLGLLAGRRRIFEDLPARRRLFCRLLVAGLAIGLPLNALWIAASADPGLAPAAWQDLAVRGARNLGGPALAAAYLAGMALLWQRAPARLRLRPLAPVGRMALTNYLSHSLVCTLLFYGYGLGFYGSIGPFWGLALAAVLFRVQVYLSDVWLDRYVFGPVEWLWRSLAYGAWQPWRRIYVPPAPDRGRFARRA